jgi:putative tryptophan/tyrosine transport system substrate-binding protein
MRRRNFIGIALGALALPTARAEKRVPVIGFFSGTVALSESFQRAFRAGLSECGYEVDRNVRVEYRYGAGKYDQLQSLADELVGLPVNAIVAVSGYPVILAAKKSTAIIPIIFLAGVDPVRFGLVQSFNKPGGNLTGIAVLSNELAAKRVELLDELLPKAVPMAVLVNSANPAYGDDLKKAEDGVRKLGREFILVQASDQSELEIAFGVVGEKKASLLVWAESYLESQRALIADLAVRHSVPCISSNKLFVDLGGLIGYGPKYAEVWRLLGSYTGRVLSGTPPADLPIMQPTEYELAINLKTAKALGLTIPASLLARADNVIE